MAKSPVNFTIPFRIAVTVLLFAIWWGGLTFYSAIVVPIGTEVSGSAVAQGVVTQQVTIWLNRIGLLALTVFAWDISRCTVRQRQRWAILAGLAAIQCALLFIHNILEVNFHPARKLILDHAAFRNWHVTYLWLTTLQWLLGIAWLYVSIHTWFTVARTHSPATDGSPSSTPTSLTSASTPPP